MRDTYEDLAVVCYINSTAELKRHSDVCVTSANAVTIVKALPNKNIFFIPDRNLARYVASQVPEKNFIFNEGFCPVHEKMRAEEIRKAKKEHPVATGADTSRSARKRYAGSLTISGVHPGLSGMHKRAARGSLLSVRRAESGTSWRKPVRTKNSGSRRQSLCAWI